MSIATPTLGARRPRSLLRTVLWLDSLSCAGMAVLLFALAGDLSPRFGLEPDFLRMVGGLLLPFAVGVAFIASRSPLPRTAVRWVIALNALWVIDSVAILLLGWVQPSALGTAAILAQALAVGVLAELEWVGLKREAAAA